MKQTSPGVVEILNERGAKVMPFELKKKLYRDSMEDAGRVHGKIAAVVGKYSEHARFWLHPWVAIALIAVDIICGTEITLSVRKFGWDWSAGCFFTWLALLSSALAAAWTGRKGLSECSFVPFNPESTLPPKLRNWALWVAGDLLPEGAGLYIENFGELKFLTVFGPENIGADWSETTFACWKNDTVIWSPSFGLVPSETIAKA